MSKKLLITSLIVALPFAVSCDNNGAERMEQVEGETQVLGTEANEEELGTGASEEMEREEVEGTVIERDSLKVDQEPADIQQREVQKGETEVDYTTKRQVTETILKEEQIPTIKVCQTKADINRMDQQDFTALGFDKQTAERIVQQRSQKGEFKSVDDLSQIQGVQSNLQQVRNELGVGQRQAEEEEPLE